MQGDINVGHGMCWIHSKVEEWSHILRFEGRRIWGDENEVY
jgi:hypothetical protein